MNIRPGIEPEAGARPVRQHNGSRSTVRAALAVAAIAAVLLLVAQSWAATDSGYVNLRWAGHPALWGFLCASGLFVAVLAGTLGRFVGVVAAVVCAVVLAGGALLAYLFADGRTGHQAWPSPDGKHMVFIDGRTKFGDPYWEVRVEETAGLAARYVNVGCIDGAVGNLDATRWVSNDAFELNIAGRSVPVVFSRGGLVTVPPHINAC